MEQVRRHRTVPALPNLFAPFIRRVQERRAIHQLELLDDHQLRDIGLHRAQIREAVEGSIR